jgi:hypothetical protein
MDDNFVNLCYEVQDVQISNPSASDKERNTFQNASSSTIKGAMQIALKSILGGIKNQSSEEEETATYLGMNGEWTVKNFSKASFSRSSYAC